MIAAAGRPPAPAPHLPGDYHVHTTFSDGAGTVEECVRHAARLGLPEIGIADHLSPVDLGPEQDWCVGHANLGRYVEEVRAAAARHGEIRVLLGVEADYDPALEAELDGLLSAWPFDYVVLGVHTVEDFAFDDEAARGDPRWDDAFLATYYRVVRRAALYRRFDVLAHFDYIGLWGHRPGPAAHAGIEAALDALAASGRALELNTDRASDPAGVMYPSDEILRAACARGIPLVIDSDAHEAADVGRFWDEAIATARRAGYRHTLRLSDRRLVPLAGGT